TGAGYRLYTEQDLARLQQIVTLKFIGLPLRAIKALLEGRSSLDLVKSLRLQRRLLEEKRRQVGLAIQAIEEVEAELKTAARTAHNFSALKKIIEIMERQTNMEWT